MCTEFKSHFRGVLSRSLSLVYFFFHLYYVCIKLYCAVTGSNAPALDLNCANARARLRSDWRIATPPQYGNIYLRHLSTPIRLFRLLLCWLSKMLQLFPLVACSLSLASCTLFCRRNIRNDSLILALVFGNLLSTRMFFVVQFPFQTPQNAVLFCISCNGKCVFADRLAKF